MEWTTWILVPAVGALIGYVTNTIAVTMLFRPHTPKRLPGLRLWGLIPKRQKELAQKIGSVVGDHLVQHEDLVKAFNTVDHKPMVESLIDRAIERKLQDLAGLPMIGSFLSPERLSGLRNGIVRAVLEQEDVLIEHLERAVEENLDVAALVEDKVAAFPSQRMEAIVLEVARRELRAIEIWGAALGALIGILQVVLLTLLV